MPLEATPTTVELALLASPGVGERTLSRWLTWCAAQGASPADWLDRAREEMVRAFPDKTGSIVQALAALTPEHIDRAARLIDRVHRAGSQFVLVTQDDYPECLRRTMGPAAPPVLTVIGDTSMLGSDAAAVVGTRRPSEAGAELARYCAKWCAARGLPVVSGGAQGVDTVAHETALTEGSATIYVLPCGALTHRIPPDVARAIEDGAALAVSQFVPDAPWTTSGAVSRNETIAALARMVCVIEPHSPGGSLKTGRDALAQDKPVLVYAGVGGPGGALLREGARPLLGPNGRYSDAFLDEAWSDAARDRPSQIELL